MFCDLEDITNTKKRYFSRSRQPAGQLQQKAQSSLSKIEAARGATSTKKEIVIVRNRDLRISILFLYFLESSFDAVDSIEQFKWGFSEQFE